ncbi:MAG TPA: TIGR03118 family protein [Pyrinomonadaceae bacterium]|jgi:uncharacterized protein (TIGR03118 family)
MIHLRSAKSRARRLTSFVLAGLLCTLGLSVLPSNVAARRASAASRSEDTASVVSSQSAAATPYRQTNLVSDWPGIALIEDPLLVNPWGISMTATSPFWIANTGTSTSTLYRGDVGGAPLIRNPGLSSIKIEGGLPTGTVANTTSDFVVTSGSASGAARFIFASLSGNITAWNPNVPAAGSTTAIIVATHTGHVYTGLAIGTSNSNNYLYAADVANGKIDVFDKNFALTTLAGSFTDPALPAGYRPFNIQNLGGKLYVAYALVNPSTGQTLPGAGNGIVSRFNTDGTFDARLVTGGTLSAPWGMVIAPASFGTYGGALLVGNFDEQGHINAFNSTTGAHLGTLTDESGQPVENDHLWALTFGNGGNGGDPNTLYFTAGIGNEQHGLFGSLKALAAPSAALIQFGSANYVIGEGGGSIQITVTRGGDVSGTSTVNYATFDQSGTGHASQKSDYEIALGKLTFAPGETSKTFRILLVDDAYVEGSETVELILSNPTGAGLGAQDKATLTIADNDTTTSTSNPIDQAQFFVRQQYLDFLNREPDPAGFNFWVNQITECGTNQACIEVRRINVSAAFFLSIEFQETGFLVYRAHKAAFGTLPRYGQFMRDLQEISRGVVIGQPGALEQLEANKQAYFNELVTRPEFVGEYPSTQTNEQYVDKLLTNAGITPAQVRLFVVQMTNGQENPPATPLTTTTGAPRPTSFGTARLRFNDAQTAMTLTATVNNIDFTGSQTADTNDNLTNAHIHASATLTPTTNAPVVWGFIGTPFNDNNPNDAVVTPFSSGVGGTVSAKWDAPEGQNTTLAAQLSNLREGRAYINFHTRQFPGGEIRGNIPAASAFRDSLVAGLNASTETRATVLRKIAENEEFSQKEFNAAFVLMQYFGYLRRNPNDPPDSDLSGYNFWLNKLNQFGGNYIAAEMVKAFITSGEYRRRFGPN